MHRNPTEAVQLKFRVREELRAKLEAAAQRRAASLNSEIVARLEASFTVWGAIDVPAVAHIVREVQKSLMQANDKIAAGDLQGASDLLRQNTYTMFEIREKLEPRPRNNAVVVDMPGESK